MKLYYAPGACSLAAHITIQELKLDIELVKVDLSTHTTEHGEDFYQISPKGYIPTLELSDGSVLTEGIAILNYLADQDTSKALTVAPETMPYYRLLEQLTFISSELHKSIGALFNPAIATDDYKKVALAKLEKRFTYLDQVFENNQFVMGEQFTIADAYLFTVINWTNMAGVDISTHENLVSYMSNISSQESVQAALKAEGLIS